MTGRLLAYLGVVVGLGFSITFNVISVRRPGVMWWEPWLAAAWPLLLFLALEILTRTAWRGRWGQRIAIVGVGVVAAIAASESYWNLHLLLVDAQLEGWRTWTGPLPIDGLMVASAAALLSSPPVRLRRPRPSADSPADVDTARTDEELLAEVAAAIDRGDLPPAPSGSALRSYLRVGANRAARLSAAVAGQPADNPRTGTHG